MYFPRHTGISVCCSVNLSFTKLSPLIVSILSSGETDANKNGIIQGQAGGDFPLNATGRMQAKKTGERLCAEAFTAVYVSDATRTLDTARAIVQENQVFNDFSKAKVCCASNNSNCSH